VTDRPLDRGLAAATVLASGGVLVAVVIWVLSGGADEAGAVASGSGLLLAIGLLCLTGLTLHRSPAIAWPSVTFAAIFATREPAAFQSVLRERGIDEAWLAAASIAAVAAVSAAVVATLYATRSERSLHGAVRPIAWGLVVWLAAASAATVALTAAGFDTSSRLPLSAIVFLPVRGWGVVVVGLSLVGIAADVLPAVRRTAARRSDAEVHPGPVAWFGAFFDELVGRADARRAAAEIERRRLAGELHADAMPAIRAVLWDLEAGRSADEIAVRLRAIAADLEGVVTERRDPVLESLGLVAALEALAERAEARWGRTVDLAIPDDGDAGRPPPGVEAAALRTAVLAVDNAVRHASAARIEIRVAADASRVDVEVVDDGDGIPEGSEADALARGRQGLAEIRRLGLETGARTTVARASDGGTTVRYLWTAR
jgi:signal transduction histidine kinase